MKEELTVQEFLIFKVFLLILSILFYLCSSV